MDDLFDTPLNPQIGRVLRASSAGFAVGCRVSELSLPAFGSLVRAEPLGGGETIIGLIYDMFVDDDQLVRRLVLADDPPAAVIEDQRRNRLLPIVMSVLTIGYEVDGRLEYGLAPRPPLNLDPVFLINRSADVARFTDNVSYLRLILRANDNNVPIDQLLVAHVRQAYDLRGDDAAWALGIIKEIIELLRSNYDLLIPTLEALSDALPGLPIPQP
ncbi:MAG: hypothetical protein KDE34_04820 [Anaerolineales bacterium]|nr:hypothetical protein [Anaerolineales bacterium]